VGVNWSYLTKDNLVADFCVHGRNPSGSIKGREFADYMSNM